MKIIKCLAENIREEMHDAEKYAKMALEYKEQFPEMLDTFLTLSRQEVSHANMLHNHIVSLIRDYRAKNGDPPAGMMAVYDWEHEKMIDNMAKVKALQEMASTK